MVQPHAEVMQPPPATQTDPPFKLLSHNSALSNGIRCQKFHTLEKQVPGNTMNARDAFKGTVTRSAYV